MPGLDKSLLYRIMRRVGEIENDVPNLAQSTDLLMLIDKPLDKAELKDKLYIDKHLVFLGQCGFLSLGPPTYDVKRGIRLTALGNIFLQPELAEFSNTSIPPDIIESLEDRIKTLTYPEEDKNGLLFQVHEAFTKQKGELVVKTLFEIASLVLKAHVA
jgi:hypothetical protein